MVRLRVSFSLGKKGERMKVRVTIQEMKIVEKIYEVDGVNTLSAAAKCATRCAAHQFQPNAYLWRETPLPSSCKVVGYEVIEG